MYGLGMADMTPAAHDMLAGDRASTWLGIEVKHASPGSAVAELVVADHHCNGLGVCHGGFIFTLADTAMAFASNAGDNRAFATNAEVDFVEAARVGDVLTATATQIVTRGKTGISDVAVLNQTNTTIAVFRGRTLAVSGGANSASSEAAS